MGVKPASVQDWIKYGRIAKGRITDLVLYFSDVANADYWGLEYVTIDKPLKGHPIVAAVGRGWRSDFNAEQRERYAELSRIIHDKQAGGPFSSTVAMIARTAMEAEAAGVPTEKLLAVHKILSALLDAQRAVSGASQEIEDVVADAELPSDKEVEGALADLGLAPDRGVRKDGRSTNRGRHRKSG